MIHRLALLRALAALVLLALAALTTPANAGKRVALVIGNGAYQQVTGLSNPTRDSADIATALRGIGFSVVELENLGKVKFEEALADFADEAAGADFAIYYYAGHGLEVDRQNYLIPVDAKLETDRRLHFEAVPLDDVLRALDGVKGIRMILLDACRNNPFAASMTITSASRSIGRGLSRVEAASGTVISYSAKAGTVAADGDGRNSPFAAALLANIATPGLEIDRLLRKVRDQVFTATNETQEPYIAASLPDKDVYLVPPEASGESSSGSGTTPITKIDTVAADYQLAERIGTREAWDAFLARHGSETDNFYVDLAKAARQKLALVVPPKVEADNTHCDGVLLASTGGTEKCLKLGDEFADCKQCPTMVMVPAGSFTMGSHKSEKDRQEDEGPQRKVKIGQAFGVGKFEVTRGQFAAFAADSNRGVANMCWTIEKGEKAETGDRSFRNPGYEQTDYHPAACVSWEDAQAYVRWLSKKTGAGYRLLTESEWEYGARAGSRSRFSFGDADSQLCEVGNGADATMRAKFLAWTGSSSCTDGHVYSAPVGTFAANDFGLTDMHGNVWEWTEDCYHDSYRGAPLEQAAWTTGDCKYRVLRGGGWSYGPAILRSAFRNRFSPDYRDSNLGFRVARTLIEGK